MHSSRSGFPAAKYNFVNRTNQWINDVISNFKAYYLQRTFRQLIDKTDGEDKQSIRDFWKNYNIMDAVDNINLSWNEVTEKCLKGVWKNVWPELSKDVDTRESIVDVDEIVKLANETGLDNINAQDIEDLLQVTTGESLSNDDLKELVEQQVHEDDEISVSEDEEQKELSALPRSASACSLAISNSMLA